jgi:hypothetical protein
LSSCDNNKIARRRSDFPCVAILLKYLISANYL